MTELTIQQRVQNGIDWLDEFGPDDWVDLVDLSRLKLSCAFRCILGLTFENEVLLNQSDVKYCEIDGFRISLSDGYWVGVSKMGENRHSEEYVASLEFRSLGELREEYMAEYDILQDEWTRRITEIRECRKLAKEAAATTATAVQV